MPEDNERGHWIVGCKRERNGGDRQNVSLICVHMVPLDKIVWHVLYSYVINKHAAGLHRLVIG